MSRWKVKKIPIGWWTGSSANGVYFSTLIEAHSHAMKQLDKAKSEEIA